MRLLFPGDFKLYVECVLLALLLSGCGAVKCGLLTVEIDRYGELPPPAGHITLRCDGKAIVEVNATTITTAKP